MKKAILFFSVAAVSGVLFAGCKQKNDDDKVNPLDYSKSSNWIYTESNPAKDVDVFYVYPTVFTGPEMIADINSEEYRAGARFMYEGQATAFETVGNMYAPYYRQSSLAIMEKSVAEKEAVFHKEPLTDLYAAFEYYINNYNNGRPFILAAHSQGSNLLMYFLKEYLVQRPDIYNRMVAAYLVGYDITQTYLDQNPTIKFADTSYDTKVIISYNTEAVNIDGPNPVMADGIGIAINPLSWTRKTTLADSSLNLGTYIERASKDGYDVKSGFADAQINSRGTISCSTINPDDYYNAGGSFPKGVLHGQDFQFYYFNLRANAQMRVDAYFGRR